MNWRVVVPRRSASSGAGVGATDVDVSWIVALAFLARGHRRGDLEQRRGCKHEIDETDCRRSCALWEEQRCRSGGVDPGSQFEMFMARTIKSARANLALPILGVTTSLCPH